MTDKQLIKQVAKYSGLTTNQVSKYLHFNSKAKRESNDFYATHPSCARDLMRVESFNHNVCDPCAGLGHLIEPFKESGYNVIASDIINRGYGVGNIDFLTEDFNSIYTTPSDFIINPPYKLLLPFVTKCIQLTVNKVAVLMPLRYLSGKERNNFYIDNPPKTVYAYIERIQLAKNGDFERYQKGQSLETYAWVIWEKDYKGETTLKWLHNVYN